MKYIIKVLLAFCIFVSQLSLLEKVKADEITNEEVSVELFEEVISKRSESSKTYRTKVNEYQTYQFASKVHYLDYDGTYQEIDNTLIESNNDDVSGYENKANVLKMKFSKKVHATNMISMKQDDHKITFGLDGITNKSDAIIESKEKKI